MKLLSAMAVTAVIAGALAASTGSRDEMVYIKAGPAVLGAPDRLSLDGPAVYNVPAFYIDRHEVSNADYEKFVAATGHKPAAFAGDDEFNQPGQPVTGVTWDDANAYCKWMGKRLPDEIEWEKAARGSNGRLYPWGNEFNARFAQLSGEKPLEISNYPVWDKTPDGLIGMAGGVSEWVNDVQMASGGVCGRGMSYQPGFVSQEKSEFSEILAGGGKLASFAPACVAGKLAVSPAVVAHNQRLSMTLARLGRTDWGMQKCAYIKGNS
ncbi:MAG TPA: hypothetical protein ENJ99_05685, partial [Rhizobiales bacterium]|nr:hypothetical protein [Hyphomicrobiales bacterium]